MTLFLSKRGITKLKKKKTRKQFKKRKLIIPKKKKQKTKKNKMTTKNYTIYKMKKKTNCKKIPRIFFAQCVNFNKFGIWNGGKQKLERERMSPSVV